MGKVERIGLPLFIILALFLSSCSNATVASATAVNISDIKADPERYQENVMVNGEYQGWSSANGSPPVTRSDWVVTDDTGWIYVTGKASGLDPVEDRGSEITIIGKVRNNSEQVYLQAEIIIIRSSQ